MISPAITLRMNQSSQVTFPVSVKKFLGIEQTATLTARMRDDGVLEISRERSIDEVRQQALDTMSPRERHRVENRLAYLQKTYPDPQDLTTAETNWPDFPWNRPELKKEFKKYAL